MLKCEQCRIREARLRLEGLVNGRQGTHLYCEECAEEVMRRTAPVEEDATSAARNPLSASGTAGLRRKWEYCLVDRSIAGISPTIVFMEGGTRRTVQIADALESMTVLGAEGWELVGIEVAVNSQLDVDGRATATGPVVSGTYYWFKRPID
jgi:hypothetical protein